MYWFFSTPGLGGMVWPACMLMVLLGGWLIVTHLFALESRERVLAGFGVGLVIYLAAANWIGRALPPFWTFTGAALLVLLLGLATAFPFRKPWLDAADLRIGGWLLAGLLLLWLWLRISKGTGLFDEYKNLAIISTLAHGQIPAIAYFGQTTLLRYHYGFHLLGASMMQLAHFTPWSAFDLSKAIVWSLSLLLAGLVGARYLHVRAGSVLMAGAVALSGGTRYLLLLLPSGLLNLIQQHVTLTGIASGNLAGALRSILPMEASPGIGYPFAFLSGINPSFMMAHGGEQTIEPMLLMLGILLMERAMRPQSLWVFAGLFSFWALASETSFVLIAAAWVILMFGRWLRSGRKLASLASLTPPTVGLLVSVPLILAQGGTISAIWQQLVAGVPVTGAGATPLPPNTVGFAGRWPPAIVSGQLGEMALTDPWATTAGILEMGLVVVMLPWMSVRLRHHPVKPWLLHLLLVTSWLGVLIPLFLAWSSEADISHITDFGVDVAIVALLLMLVAVGASAKQDGARAFRLSGGVALALSCLPGLVLLAIQVTAAQNTVFSEHYGDAEARLLQQAWGRLPRDSKTLGTSGPASILTGQLTGGIYTPPPGEERPVWEEMLVEPRLSTLVEHDFDFVYVNSRWWDDLNARSQEELQSPCITTFARGEAFPGGNFAEILDLRGCR